MDLLQQFDTAGNSEAGAKLHIKTPTGDLLYLDNEKEKPVMIEMLGVSSVAHQSHTIKKLRENQAQQKGKTDANEIKDTFFADTIDAQVERLCSVVIGWEHMPTVDGKEFKFSKENVKALMTKYQEIRNQALSFLDNTLNFIKS